MKKQTYEYLIAALLITAIILGITAFIILYPWGQETTQANCNITPTVNVTDAELAVYQQVSQETRMNHKTNPAYFMQSSHPKIIALCKQLNQQGVDQNLTPEEFAQYLLNYVYTAIQYAEDKDTTPYNDYYNFPIETLALGYGDCEDTAMLYMTLLDYFNYDYCAFITNTHYFVGIAGNFSGNQINGYYYADTTTYNYIIGNPVVQIEGERVWQYYP